MISVIVVFPKLEEAKSIKNLLVRNGIDVIAACSTGAQVVNLIDDLDYGIVVSGYRMVDMMYSELLEYLPDTFDMLLVVSKRYQAECSDKNLIYLSMPIKAADLIHTVNQMYDELYDQMRRKKSKPAVRTEQEQQIIINAKQILMDEKGITEEEAHKYLQKKSMDNGTNLVETAQMVLDMF
ncbi:MAG: ANTAR domain-containing protein [Clostridium sp.]|nr:ANTAR domain-containing protein [Clostridium sp.]